MSKLVPTTKQLKQTAIDGGELLGGMIAAHAVSTQIKTDKKWVNPLAAFISAYFHATSTNSHVKSLALGTFGYFGLKSLNDLKTTAVAGLQGIEGMEGVRDILNKLVPSLGEAEVEILSGDELAAAEEVLLGLLGGNEFTPYSEVPNKQVSSSVSNL